LEILAIGAHPDDIEIGCGGLLIKAASAGHSIHILDLTRGEAGGGNSSLRENEARKSAKVIGAKNLWFGEYKDTELVPNGALVNSIEEFVKKVNPLLILTHSIHDDHHDHRAVGYATIEAGRYCENILAYENPLTKDFKPEVFVDISDVIDKKTKLLTFYQTQKNKTYLKKNAIYGLASYRSLQSRLEGVTFAEAYQVIKLKILDQFLNSSL
jgi:LmbE family N-acetylglucosaminyl deacetylase